MFAELLPVVCKVLRLNQKGFYQTQNETNVQLVKLWCPCRQMWLYIIVYIIFPADIVCRAIAVGGGESWMHSRS